MRVFAETALFHLWKALLPSTRKLALLGKNDFEQLAFPLPFFRYGKAITKNTLFRGGRGGVQTTSRINGQDLRSRVRRVN